MPELTHAPNLSALYLKAVATSPTRRGGSALPDTEYVRREVSVDRDHLAAYNRVCGFGLRDALPPTYPHILSFGMSVRLMTDPGFPFPLVGTVHIANTITQNRPLLVTDELTQAVRVENLRPHNKGTQFDVVTETSVGEEIVWREASTYLRVGKSDDSVPHEGLETPGDKPERTGTWRLPADLGRQYAEVSGDHNPIHLHQLTAKAFGFPRAIAHGMWSKARCLAAFEGRLPESFTVRVDFRKPVLLPSTVDFSEQRRGNGHDFSLYSKSGKPHLLGSLSA